MVHRGGNTCFFSQSGSVVLIADEIFAQQFQRHQTVQEGVTRLINRPHSTKAKRIKQYEMIERSFHSHFFTTPGTGHSGQWFRVGCIDRRAAGRACLCHRVLPSTAIETDCNIQRLQSNEMAAVI